MKWTKPEAIPSNVPDAEPAIFVSRADTGHRIVRFMPPANPHDVFVAFDPSGGKIGQAHTAADAVALCTHHHDKRREAS